MAAEHRSVRRARELVQVVADARGSGGRPSRSAARAGAVHVRVRAIALRNRTEGETPAAAAFSRQAAHSADVTRAATITVRRAATN